MYEPGLRIRREEGAIRYRIGVFDMAIGAVLELVALMLPTYEISATV